MSDGGGRVSLQLRCDGHYQQHGDKSECDQLSRRSRPAQQLSHRGVGRARSVPAGEETLW